MLLHKKYRLLQNIGSGNQGIVRLAECVRGSPKLVAIKTLQKNRPITCPQTWAYRLKNERDNWIRVGNKRSICTLYDVLEDDEMLHLVTEYCPYGTLADTSFHPLFQKQLMHALESCHNENICHGDIKPDNIFIDVDGNLRLGDFGCSQVASGPNEGLFVGLHTCGTVAWVAPEILARREYGYQADVWSAGKILASYNCLPPDIIKGLLDEDPTTRLKSLQVLENFS